MQDAASDFRLNRWFLNKDWMNQLEIYRVLRKHDIYTTCKISSNTIVYFISYTNFQFKMTIWCDYGQIGQFFQAKWHFFQVKGHFFQVKGTFSKQRGIFSSKGQFFNTKTTFSSKMTLFFVMRKEQFLSY